MESEPLLRLAAGELTRAEIGELDALKRQVQKRSGLLCAGYKDRCFRRRVAVRMRARGVSDYAAYRALLRRDPEEYDRFLSALTINVSKFFRNVAVWRVVRERILPTLVDSGVSRLRMWSAGSATGEEAYSLAILVREEAARRNEPTLPDRVEILGTDVDGDVVAAARTGRYGAGALAETPAAIRRRWFTEEAGRFLLGETVRRAVRFEVGDLLAGPLPESQHLIFCRNVMIYFERELQEHLLSRLADALVPGGFLILGQVETLVGDAGSVFRAVASRERVYQKRT